MLFCTVGKASLSILTEEVDCTADAEPIRQSWFSCISCLPAIFRHAQQIGGILLPAILLKKCFRCLPIFILLRQQQQHPKTDVLHGFLQILGQQWQPCGRVFIIGIAAQEQRFRVFAQPLPETAVFRQMLKHHGKVNRLLLLLKG